MSSTELLERELRFGPGEVWTRNRRYACDGVVLRVIIRPGVLTASIPESHWELKKDGLDMRLLDLAERVVIEQVHDLNEADHRTRSEVSAHLRRCLKLILAEGLLLLRLPEMALVPTERLHPAASVVQRLYQRPSRTRGPFHEAVEE